MKMKKKGKKHATAREIKGSAKNERQKEARGVESKTGRNKETLEKIERSVSANKERQVERKIKRRKKERKKEKRKINIKKKDGKKCAA